MISSTEPFSTSAVRRLQWLGAVASMLLLLGVVAPVRAGIANLVSFSKTFAPDTIGPGSVSTLTFTIDNGEPAPVTDLAFSDTLPAGVTLADPVFATNGCGGTLTAPAGGTVISLTGGQVGAQSSCLISVDVTSSVPGGHLNVSGSLSSSVGDSGSAAATLTVATDRPGFFKVFSPATVQLGATSTLTFTIDNSLNPSGAVNLAFSDALPGGIEIASPSNASTTCTGGVLTAPVGGTTFSFGPAFPGDASVGAMSSCTVSVDVTATGVGLLDNRSSELSSLPPMGPARSSGKASATLLVLADELALRKSFLDDPVLAGGTATLRFTLTNFNRGASATGIGFTDDLDATLMGLVAVAPLPAAPCGGGSSLTGTGFLTFTGGSLGPAETCIFDVTVQVPAGAAAGSYPNTTSGVTGTVEGNPVVGSPATDSLVVDIFPTLTKTFLSSPVGTGSTVDVEFTITNNSATFNATDITFSDTVNIVAGATPVGMFPVAACNGSLLRIFDFPGGGDITLLLTGGSLAAGASCNFTVTLQIAVGAPSGTFTNTTSEVTATVDGANRTGPPASDTLDVVAPPTLLKEFTDDPADPGGLVTLEFTLLYDEFAIADATDIAFTDDLDATLTGLTAIGLPLNDVCGLGSLLDGVPDASNLVLTGGTLAPGESCTIPVTLQVPMAAPAGFHTNTTSEVTATVAGVSATGTAATDDLLIAALTLTKEFLGDPALPGSLLTLRFTITNDNPASDATGIFFTDSLTSALSGLAAVAPLPTNPCGAGSTISGTTSLIFTGGNLTAGTFCTFDVTVQVPLAAVPGDYVNLTSNLIATLGGVGVVLDPATDTLTVETALLELAKEFTDDPVNPGDTVTLEFTLTNLSATATVTGITFTDDLDATLSGLVSESGTQNDVCGAGSQLAGMGVLSFTGGSLGPGASCVFNATLRVPDVIVGGSVFPNVTSTPAGTASGVAVDGSPGADDLLVNLVSLSKAFDGPTAATGSALLTFTLENLSDTVAVTSLGFTDDLDAVVSGLVATDTPQSGICGAGSQITGSSFLTFSGGSLDPGATCVFAVTVAVPSTASPGIFPNTTSDLFTGGLRVSDPAADSLQIEPPPTFAKVFFPNAITVGGVTTLTFTVNNTASTIAANDLAFTDNLPAGLEVASPANVANGCGGTVTATAGSGSILLTGGTVGAGSSCTVQVDVTGTTEGTFVNTTGDLISSSGNSGPAGDTLDVVVGDFVVLKSFRTEPVLRGGLVEMELSIVNGSTFALTDIALTDDLDAVLPGLAAEGLPLSDVCGAGSQVSGTSVVSLTGGNVAPGASCTVVVPVRVPADAPLGSFTNTTSTITAQREGVPVEASSASADLTVAFVDFTKSFTPSTVEVQQTVQLAFSFANPDPANGISGLTFTDDLSAVLPGLVAVDTPKTDVCGVGSQISGDAVLVFTGGSLGPGASCGFSVTLAVPSVPGGVVENVAGVLEGTVGGEPVAGDPPGARALLEIVGILAIPTLSFGMLLLLAGLLAVAALWRLR